MDLPDISEIDAESIPAEKYSRPVPVRKLLSCYDPVANAILEMVTIHNQKGPRSGNDGII